MKTNYVQIFGWFLVIINSGVIITLIVMLIYHWKRLMKKTKLTCDIDFHFMVFLMAFFFLIANCFAFSRNLNVFLIHPINLTDAMLESTLMDRTAMWGTAIVMFLLGRKYRTDWYNN